MKRSFNFRTKSLADRKKESIFHDWESVDEELLEEEGYDEAYDEEEYNEAYEEEYAEELTLQQFDIAFPITVPEGCVFVLGDNRSDSLDSRSTEIGCIDERYIIGKVVFGISPFGKVE